MYNDAIVTRCYIQTTGKEGHLGVKMVALVADILLA